MTTLDAAVRWYLLCKKKVFQRQMWNTIDFFKKQKQQQKKSEIEKLVFLPPSDTLGASMLLINNHSVFDSTLRCFAYLYSCGHCLNSLCRYIKYISIIYIYISTYISISKARAGKWNVNKFWNRKTEIAFWSKKNVWGQVQLNDEWEQWW